MSSLSHWVGREVTGWRIFLVCYGIIVATAAAVAAQNENYFGNVGFLVIGTLVGIFPAFVIEEIRRSRENKAVTVAMFHELANRVGRCCFDFEDPWGAYLAKPETMDVTRLRKFVPEAPTIYPAVAERIAHLPDQAVQPVMDFFIAMSAWRREIETQAEEFDSMRAEVSHGAVKLLAKRLRRTLSPGRRALATLAPYVKNADEIERKAMRDGDELFAKRHPNAGKTFRERIDIMLKSTSE